MSIFYHPPQPHIGASQPLESRKLAPSNTLAVDNPPFASGLRNAPLALALIASLWLPGPPSAQASKFLPQQIVSVDLPPSSHALRYFSPQLLTILESWKPPPPPPQRAVPVVPIPSTDNPPQAIGALSDFYSIRQQWEPGPPQPPRIVPAQIVSVDNPPFVHPGRNPLPLIRRAWEPPDPQPWPGWALNPVFENVPSDNPPFGAKPLRIDQVQPWSSQAPAKIAPLVVVVQVDNPPFGQKLWLPTVVRNWTATPIRLDIVEPLLQVEIPQNPPFGIPQRWLWQILQSWRPGDPLPQRLPNYPQGVIITPDNPPFRVSAQLLYQLVDSWREPPFTIRYVPGEIQLPDNPPFGILGPNFYTILSGWRPDTRAQQRRIYFPGGVAVTVDNPPFSHPGRNPLPWIVKAWEAAVPQPQRFFPTQIVSVDNPPFLVKPLRLDRVEIWQPPTLVKIAPLIVVVTADNPPFALPGRNLYTILSGWKPDAQVQQRRIYFTQGVDVFGGTTWPGWIQSHGGWF